MKKICFIAQFPPPIHGLSKAVQTLYNSELSQIYCFERINITNNKKFPGNLMKIMVSNADLFYLTISQTKGGNLRDLVILKVLDYRHKKCLVHLHGGYYRQLIDNDVNAWQRRLNYKAMKKLAGAIVLGKSLQSIFKNMIPDDRVFTVPNCVDDEYLITDTEFENKIRSLSQRKIKHILYLSNFIRSKGYPKVLEMAKIEKASSGMHNFHFDFAGKFFDESEEEFFWNYIKENGIEEYITYHGIVDGNKKKELLRECDIFCLLTTYPNEGQPISILEAMGNGMTIVTTDHAGIPDQITDNVNGLLINKNNINSAAIYKRLANMDVREFEMIARNNRHDIIEKYSQTNYIQRMNDCFLQCVDR